MISFKGITCAYLLKISIAHNKDLNPLLNLLITCTPIIVYKIRVYYFFLEFSNNWLV